MSQMSGQEYSLMHKASQNGITNQEDSKENLTMVVTEDRENEAKEEVPNKILSRIYLAWIRKMPNKQLQCSLTT